MSKSDQIQKLLKATEANTLEQAVELVEKALPIAAQQNYILSNMGVLTIVYGPTGMGLFTLSPSATQSLENLAMVEKAILDFQSTLIQRRQQLLHRAAQPETPKE
jgi:hypothetical protein